MNFKLIKTKKNLNKNYKIISNKITSSIFIHLGFNFFKQMVQKNIIHLYNVKLKNKIVVIITVVEYKHYKILSKKIFYHLIQNPLIIIKNFFFLVESLKKNTNLKINKNYLHLLHLIILKNNFLNISIKKKDALLTKFYKKILKNHKANQLFLCFEKNNLKAYRYYSRNKFKIFNKNTNIVYLKKKFD